MTPLAVLKNLNIFLDCRLGMSARLITLVMGHFVLQATPEAFHRGVIVAISFPGHGSLGEAINHKVLELIYSWLS